jgi:hypothetical protein
MDGFAPAQDMHAGLRRRRRHQLIASILLIALAFRALVPTGFMPAAGQAFTLEICPDGFPAQLLHPPMDHEHGAHHSHGASHHHDPLRCEHCGFAAVAGAGPAAHSLLVLVPLSSTLAPLLDAARQAYRAQRFLIQQPRAPPASV